MTVQAAAANQQGSGHPGLHAVLCGAQPLQWLPLPVWRRPIRHCVDAVVRTPQQVYVAQGEKPLSPYLGKIIMYPSASLCCSRWEKGKIVSLSPGLGNDIVYSGIHTSANSGCSRWEESENATLSPDLGNDTVYSGTNSSANSGCAVWESHAVPWSC